MQFHRVHTIHHCEKAEIVREEVYHILNSRHPLELDTKDIVDRLDNVDFIRRYLAENRRCEYEAARAIVRCLQLRSDHQIGGNQRSSYFNDDKMTSPSISSRQCLKFGRDKYDQLYICDQSGFQMTDETGIVDWRQWCHFLDRLESENGGSVYVDMSDVTVTSLASRFSLKFLEVYRTCYPGLIRNIYLYSVPCPIRPILALLLHTLPNKYTQRISVISSNEANNLMNTDFSKSTTSGDSYQLSPSPTIETTADLARRLSEVDSRAIGAPPPPPPPSSMGGKNRGRSRWSLWSWIRVWCKLFVQMNKKDSKSIAPPIDEAYY